MAKRTIKAQGVVVESRGQPHPGLVIREGTSPVETSFDMGFLKQNPMEALPGQKVTIFSDGKFHIGDLPPNWE